MGKGAGSVCGKPAPSKQESTEPTPQTVPVQASKEAEKPAVSEVAKVETPKVEDTPAPVAATQPNSEKMAETKKIYIIFYSTYGHIYTMAKAVKEGVDSVEGVEGVLYQVPETLPAEVLEKMHAPPKPDVPIIDRDDLPNAAGFIFGIPTRFGTPAAQIKSFWDSTGSHWQSGALVGKPVSIFVSTATLGGGQETTALTALPNFVHHGMIFVPPGYSFGGQQFDVSTAHGGSAWGAGTLAGPTGAQQPTEGDLAHAKHQGTYFAKVALKLAA